MDQKRIVPFKISHMDSLGQGVSKETDKITFIAKSLPGDQGDAIIRAEKKGVAFGSVNQLSKESPQRIVPVCPHFEVCPSCHYLHTSYADELQFKQSSLEKLFQKWTYHKLHVIGAPRRLEYRNRIQLHYDLKTSTLGMFNLGLRQIIPVPRCTLGILPVQQEVWRLYSNAQWVKEVPPGSPVQGHLEIYFVDQKLRVNWNKPYADGGFSQVFEEMNQVLKKELKACLGENQEDILDLFAGKGNLTNELNYSKRLCVDLYPETPAGNFYSQDLYDPRALQRVQRELSLKNISPSLIVLDPPRSGLKDLKNWIETLKPLRLAYISCDPHTLARDLLSLENYTIKDFFLIDFFPSTYHFETFIFLERKR